MLLRHYLERGVSKAELSRLFGVSRRTIHSWVPPRQLGRQAQGEPRIRRPAGERPGGPLVHVSSRFSL